jgi:hypothetical protein
LGFGFGVWGFRFKVSGFRFGVWGLGFRVSGREGLGLASETWSLTFGFLRIGFRVLDLELGIKELGIAIGVRCQQPKVGLRILGFRVQGSGFRGEDLGFRI